MKKAIEAIFLDTGNTLTTTVPDLPAQTKAMEEIARLLGSKDRLNVLLERLSKNYEGYKDHVKRTMVEPSETELWTRWMAPTLPASRITPVAAELTLLWTGRKGRREARPDVRETLAELGQRGYLLGIIANALSTREIPEWLEGQGLQHTFKTVVLSSQFGRRKPDPYIYLEAARLAGVEPGACAYVGDNPSRDISGARQAGFGKVVIFLESRTLEKEPPKVKERPDAMISTVRDLLTVFPPR